MNLAKQNTAITFLVGPILDSAGAAKTDEVIGSFKVTKNGTVGAVDAQDTLAHNHTGHYVYTSDGGDFDTLGEVMFSLNSGTNAMAPVKFQVVPANVYNSIVAGSDYLDVEVAAQANIDFGAAQKSSLNAATPAVTVSDKTGFALSSTGADLILKSSTFIQAIVAAVNEFATYGLTALNTLLVTIGIKTATTAAPTDMATATSQTSILSKLLKYVQLLARKDAAIATDNAIELTAINADGGSGAGAFSNQTDSQEAIRDATVGGGAGAISWTYTLTDSITGLPIADAHVWVTTDSAGSNVIASGTTNQLGVVTFMLDAGTVYVWRAKSGYDFTNPDTEVVA